MQDKAVVSQEDIYLQKLELAWKFDADEDDWETTVLEGRRKGFTRSTGAKTVQEDLLA